MSILSSLVHGEMRDLPNDVHNISSDDTKIYEPGTLSTNVQVRMNAMREGAIRPALFYTEQEQTPCRSGVWDSPHTVASRLESKEEYPLG